LGIWDFGFKDKPVPETERGPVQGPMLASAEGPAFASKGRYGGGLRKRAATEGGTRR